MAITEPPITPACIKVLAATLDMHDRGEVPTHGKIVKELGLGKRAISESLRRLERDGWIKRPPYRAGCVREIRIVPPRIVVEKTLGIRHLAAKKKPRKHK